METATLEAGKGFTVNASTLGVTLRLYGDVGWDVMAADVASALASARDKPVTAHVFSYGGSAGEGLAIYNILAAHEGGVTTVIDGIAASAGGLIFMAGQRRIMPANALFHLHSAWGNASGDGDKMRSVADQFDAHTAAYKGIYVQKSGQDETTIDAWMKAGQGQGTWFSAVDAMDAGFATEVTPDAEQVSASAPPLPAGRFQLLPEAALAWVGDSGRIEANPNIGDMAVSASAAEAAPNEQQVSASAVVESPAQASVPQPAPQASETPADVAMVRREVEIRRIAAHASLTPDQVDALVAGGKPLAEVTVEIVRAHAATAQNPSTAGHPARLQVARDHGDTLAQAFGDELARRAGLINEPTEVGRQVLGYSAREMCRAWLDRSGVNTSGRTVTDLISLAFHSTSDLPALFESTANKSLRAGYEEEEQTWGPLSSRGDLPDFKKATEVDFNARLVPQPLQEGGAYKAAKLVDGKGTWQLSTYALEVGITRQMIVNDDLSALGEIPMMQGRGCRLLESNLIWNLITKVSLGETVSLDGKALFHADHNNTVSGGTSVIGIAGMDLAKTKLRKQTDTAGNSLNLRPAFLIVPPELDTNAMQFLYPTGYAPTTLTGANGTNPFARGVELIVENRLTEVTNGTKMWYLTSSPNRVPMIRHGYLSGEAGPTLTQEEKRNPDVLSMLVRMDFGCTLRDWRGFVRSAGE